MRIFVLITLLFTTCLLKGQMVISPSVIVTGPQVIKNEQLFAVVDRFEESYIGQGVPSLGDGYDSNLITTTNGVISPDATDRNIGDSGSQSFKIDATTTTGFIRYVTPSMMEHFVDFKFQFDTLPSTGTAFNLLSSRDGSGNIQGQLALTTTGNFRSYNGTSFNTSTAAAATDTTYYGRYFWGAAGTTSFSFSTTFPPPSSGTNFVSITGGTGTTASQRLQIAAESGNGMVIWYDDVFLGYERFRQ